MKRLVMMLVVMAICAVTNASTFDSDGFADIFVTNTTGLYWYEGTGTNNTVGLTATITSASNITAVAAGKLDTDDNYDLCIGRSGSNGTWYEGNGVDNGIGWVANLGNAVGVNAGGLAIGDLDGDGKGEYFYLRSNGYMDWYESTGVNNTLGWVGAIGASLGVSVGMGDLDNDGELDLYRAHTTALSWYESAGDNLRKFIVNMSTGGIKDIAVGDFDGDSLNDMFVIKADGSLTWYEGKTNDAVPSHVGSVLVTGANCLALGDVDGDGISELLVGTANGVDFYEAGADNQLVYASGTAFGGDVRDIAIVPVPEPATMVLLGLGGIALIRKRK